MPRNLFRVLLVDDDKTGARQIADMLAHDGDFVCDHVGDLSAANQILRAGRYQAVVLSLTLKDYPGLAGLALLQSMVPRAPIIAIAPDEQEALGLKAVQQGASDYLLREHIYPTVLIRSIKHATERLRVQDLQVQTEQALQWERDFTTAVIETAGCLIMVLDRHGRIVQFNQTCEQLTGYTMKDVRARQLWDFLVVSEERAAIQEGFEALVGGRYPSKHESHLIARDGTRHLIAWSNTAITQPNGDVEFVIATGIPFTERRRAEEALRRSEAKYRALFEESRDAIFMTDVNGTIVESNRSMHELLGFNAEELIGRSIDSLFVNPAERHRFRQEWSAKGMVSEFEAKLRHKEDSARWCLASLAERRVHGGALLGYQGILHDITDRKHAEERLIYNAYHDTLTGLPNRALFSDRLDRALVRWHRHSDELFAVLFFDLDRFKIVNDSLGHSSGDELLIQIARKVNGCVREEDTLARLGGDEFAILLDRIESVTDAVLVAERIHSCLDHPITIGGQSVYMSCSIGIALPSSLDEAPEDLLRSADIAMYRAKAEGPARQAIYTPSMHSAAVTVLELDTDLRVALQEQQFVVHYQPIYMMDTGRISGFEALLRWQHPRRGLLMPAEFLLRAEETGLIVPIGRWVLRHVCEQLRVWNQTYTREQLPSLNLNVSGKQLAQPDFVSEIAAAIHEFGVSGDRLMFELTETSLMQNPESCALTITRLRELGVRFCIDDFGTGYSSLSYLHRLPINGLKIDRSFITRLEQDGEGSELVSTIVALADHLGIDAVAEGVETELQLSSVRRLGPKYVQGFYLSRPLEPAAAIKLLTATY